MWKWELNTPGSELLGVVSQDILSGDNSSSDDLNGTWSGTMSTGHLIVKLSDGTAKGEVSVLTVHIVSSRSGVISQPDTVVLDVSGVLLVDLDNVKDFSGRLLHLSELVHEIPVLGSSDDNVWGEDKHSVSLWVWELGGWCLSSDNLVLVHWSTDSHI